MLAITGAFIGYKLRIPMGAVLGAMLFVGTGKAFSLLHLESSDPFSFIVQVSLGLMIGLSFTRLSKQQFSQVRNSLIFVIVSVVTMTILTGYIVSFFPFVTRSVAILSSAPGGMVEMATMAEALDLEAPAVVFLHFIRLLIVMLVFPQIIKYFFKTIPVSDRPGLDLTMGQPPLEKKDEKTKEIMRKYTILVIAALTGAFVGFLTGFPIGALLGSLITVVVINLKTGRYRSLPITVKRGIQTLIGGSIGLNFSKETFLILPKLIAPALVITIMTIVFALIFASLLSKFLKVDYLTAVCGLAPAGMSEMVLIAEHYQVNIPTVVTMHLFRIITIVTLIPVIVYSLF